MGNRAKVIVKSKDGIWLSDLIKSWKFHYRRYLETMDEDSGLSDWHHHVSLSWKTKVYKELLKVSRTFQDTYKV